MPGQEVLTAQQQDEAYMPQMPRLREWAEERYAPVLTYHTWQHALDTAEVRRTVRSEMLEANLPYVPGLFRSEAGALLHDADLLKFILAQRNGDQLAYSAEAYTVSTFSPFLTDELGVDEITTTLIGHDVMGTMRKVVCDTAGRLSLCIADMWNTGEDHTENFKPKSDAYREECEIVDALAQGRDDVVPIDPDEFERMSLPVLGDYWYYNIGSSLLLQDFPFGQEFHRRMGNNLMQDVRRQSELQGAKLGVFAHELGSFSVQRMVKQYALAEAQSIGESS